MLFIDVLSGIALMTSSAGTGNIRKIVNRQKNGRIAHLSIPKQLDKIMDCLL